VKHGLLSLVPPSTPGSLKESGQPTAAHREIQSRGGETSGNLIKKSYFVNLNGIYSHYILLILKVLPFVKTLSACFFNSFPSGST
jgi:hypothetical protein